MAKRVTLPAAGLATDPNPLLTAAQGAMRAADNVIVVSDGAVMLRPGFGTRYTKSTTYRPRALTVFDGAVIVASRDGGTWRLENTSGTYTGEAEPLDPVLSPPQFAEARKSLYLTTLTGIRKLADASDSATSSAGVEMLVATLGADDIVGTGDIGPGQWAYRLVFVKTDANGYIRRSPPSSAIQGATASTGDRYRWSANQSRVHIPSWIVEDDQIEAYRTRASGNIATPSSAEYYLAFTYTVTATDVSNGYCVFPDDYTVDDSLGAALYTNPSQSGIIASKEPPPASTAIAYWSSCLWLGGTVERGRLPITFLDVGRESATGVTVVFNNTVGYTLGSPNVTGLTDITGIEAGMKVSDLGSRTPITAGTYVPANTTVLSTSGVGPYTLVMSANALATGTAEIYAHSIVEVNGVEFYAHDLQDAPGYVLSAPRCFRVDDGTDLPARIALTAYSFANTINVYATQNESTFPIRATRFGDALNPIGSVPPGLVMLEEIGVGGTAFTFESVTRPLAMLPTTEGGAVSATIDNSPARLFWSDPDEPEAVPAAQYVDVGNQRDPIMALVPLRSALLVFKRDGIYRVTGAAPDAWSVELLDGSTRLLSGSCVDVLDDRAFAFTNRGAVMVDEGGVRNISERRIGRDLLEAQRLIASPDDEAMGFVRAWSQAGCVAFCLPTLTDSDNKFSRWFVYRPISDSWTRWPIEATCCGQDPRSSSFFYARPSMWEIRENSSALESVGESGFDSAYILGAWTYNAATPAIVVSDAQRGTWAPKAGDIAFDSNQGEYRRIIAVNTVISTTTCTLDSAFTGSPSQGTVYETILPVMQWQAHCADPIMESLYREVQVLIDLSGEEDDDAAELQFDVGASTNLVTTAASETKSIARVAAPPPSTVLRMATDRQTARATHFYPYLAGGNIFMPWVCLGVGLVFEPASERTAR